MRNTVPENIQEHSLQVAILSHALTIIKNTYFGGMLDEAKASLYAIYHDCNEIITGDLPTPIKYNNPEISESYHKIESISKDKLISMMPNEFKDHYKKILFFEDLDSDYKKIVKAADRLSAYIKCIEEMKAGNREFNKAAETIKLSIEKMEMPELNYFMENFIPAYFLTLDEME